MLPPRVNIPLNTLHQCFPGEHGLTGSPLGFLPPLVLEAVMGKSQIKSHIFSEKYLNHLAKSQIPILLQIPNL